MGDITLSHFGEDGTVYFYEKYEGGAGQSSPFAVRHGPRWPPEMAYDLRYNATLETCEDCGAAPGTRHEMGHQGFCRRFMSIISNPRLREPL